MTIAVDLQDAEEQARIAVVHAFDILDTPSDGTFDRIAAVAARTFDVPIGIVSIVDTDRIWFKAHHGLSDVEQIDREVGLCASAILHDQPWVVVDAATDPRTLTNSLVAGEFGLRFYAGVPLTTSAGFNLGTLCVLDTEPREVADKEMQTLRDLAAVVVDELERRLATRVAVEAESRLRHEAERLARALQSSLLPPHPPDVPGMEIATRYLAADHTTQVGGDFFDVFRVAPNDWAIVLGDACGKGASAASVAALARWAVRSAALHHLAPCDVLKDVNALLCNDAAADDDRFCTMVLARLELDARGAWVTHSSGGHPLPLLVRRTGTVEERGSAGLPIGIFETVTMFDDRIGLVPGDSLVFYTDGITEVRNDEGEQFGAERLGDVVLAVAGEPAETIASAVVHAARTFAERLHDDVALVVLRVPENIESDPIERAVLATTAPADALL